MLKNLSRIAIRLWERLKGIWMRLVNGLLRASAPIFLTEFQISPNWEFPPDFKIKDFGGLLVCHIINRGTSGARLFAWWDSPTVYTDCWTQDFRRALKLSDPMFLGVMVKRKSNIDHWWKKGTIWYSLAMTMIAIVTNWNSLKSSWNSLFASPDTTLTALKDRVEMVVGDPCQLTINLSNHTRDDCDVRLKAPLVFPNQGLQIQEGIVERKVTEESALSVVYSFSAQSPRSYDLNISGAQHSGFFPGWKEVKELHCKIVVLPIIDRVPSVEYGGSAADRRSASFIVTARHGHPPGPKVEYRAQISGDDLAFEGVARVNGSGSAKITHVSSHGGIAILVWTVDAKATPDQHQFQVTVKRTIETDENYWKDKERKFVVYADVTDQE
jgi:hypothetical protein